MSSSRVPGTMITACGRFPFSNVANQPVTAAMARNVTKRLKCAERIRLGAQLNQRARSGCAIPATTAVRHAFKMPSLRSIDFGPSDHEIIEHDAIGRAAQLLEEFRHSKPSGDGSQRVRL